MKLKVTDLISGETKLFGGSPEDVEADLRVAYRGITMGIPQGDLARCIQELSRSTYVVEVQEGQVEVKPHLRPYRERPARTHAWAREEDRGAEMPRIPENSEDFE